MTNINVLHDVFDKTAVGKVHKGFHNMASKINPTEILKRLRSYPPGRTAAEDVSVINTIF